ncbi:EF-hand domain-containing protein [Brevundimonas naejangsanensis]|uniref:EF-hand domain-containing protein n=1 Tax=Brevundimonas naejangsanensis TaxID=588932 RepID=UPI0026F171C8|nr:EF-hand domain-containing protein [Brevundimonas naejangsanensis]
MKTILAAAAVSALMLTLGGAAAAQTTPETGRQARMAQSAGQPISQADFVQRRVERLRAADANGDGQVTAEEMRGHAQARRAERRAAQLDRLDADKDGSISRAEFEAPRQQACGEGRMAAGRWDHARGGMKQGRMGGHAARGGADRFPIVIAEAERKATESFARMDANRDGMLSVEERRAAMQAGRAEMRQKREMRRMQRPSAERPQGTASPSAPVSE